MPTEIVSRSLCLGIFDLWKGSMASGKLKNTIWVRVWGKLQFPESSGLVLNHRLQFPEGFELASGALYPNYLCQILFVKSCFLNFDQNVIPKGIVL